MSDWGGFTSGRKGKKAKKKQGTSMTEPDLEAGNHIAESEAAELAKAVYDDTKPSAPPPNTGVEKEDMRKTEDTIATGTKEFENSEEDIRGTTQNVRNADAFVDGDNDVTGQENELSAPTDTSKSKNKRMESRAKAAKSTSIAEEAQTLRPTGCSPAISIKTDTKQKLDLIPLVHAWSFTPELPKRVFTTKAPAAKDAAPSRSAPIPMGQRLTTVPLVHAWSFTPEAPKKKPATKTDAARTAVSVPPRPAKQQLALVPLVASYSVTPKPPLTTSRGPQSFPPFDHAAFSRWDNHPRPTTWDHGIMYKVQMSDGTYTRMHGHVFCQSSLFVASLVTSPAFFPNLKATGRVSFRPRPHFTGLTKTYVHWLYAGNFPTSTIDVRDRTKVGAVLLHLAEEYVLGSQIEDFEYMDDVMDAFITIHVQTRKLTFRSVIEVVYAGCPEGSQMRKLLADMHAFALTSDVSKMDVSKDMDRAFVEDVLRSSVTLKPREVAGWWWFLRLRRDMYLVG